jgi:hypothetical protein
MRVERGERLTVKKPENITNRGSLSVKFQEVVHAKESWDTWVNEDPKHPTTSNA